MNIKKRKVIFHKQEAEQPIIDNETLEYILRIKS